MDNKYKRISTVLKKCAFDVQVIDGISQLIIDFQDDIKINSITEKGLNLTIRRNLTINNLPDVLAYAEFSIVIDTSSTITIEEFKNDLNNDIRILSGAFARISLSISQLSQMSSIGPIITPPSYNIKKLTVS